LNLAERQAVRAHVAAFNERTLLQIPARCVICNAGPESWCAFHPGVCCFCVDVVYQGKLKHALDTNALEGYS
jgi:hypothetical protein